MTDFIIKYWVEVLFGLLCAGGVAFFKLFWSLAKKEYERQRKDVLESLKQQMDEQKELIIKTIDERENKLLEADDEIRQTLHDMQVNDSYVKSGMLSLQGRIFKRECHALLEPGHIITLQEFEIIVSEHITYNSLGGNHEGDALFKLVEEKYKNTLNGEV